jgi:hypothetical protein
LLADTNGQAAPPSTIADQKAFDRRMLGVDLFPLDPLEPTHEPPVQIATFEC